MTDPRTPVQVLTGFLGSGKTTLVNRLLQAPDAPPTAVLVNEFGDAPVDGSLVISSDEEIVELANGCVCCTVRGDLVAAILGLLERRQRGLLRAGRPFERLLIETSGLASPGPVVQTLLVEPRLAEALRPAAVVTLCNAERVEEQLAAFPEAVEQVGYADLLLLNHADRVEAAALGRAEQALRARNPEARLERTRFAELDLTAFEQEASGVQVRAAEEAEGGGSLGGPHGHTEGAGTVVLRSDEPLSLHTLKIWLAFLANRRTHELWRLKGVVRCREVDERVVVQGVYQHLTIGPEPGPVPDESVLVLIGRGLDRDELERGWARTRGA